MKTTSVLALVLAICALAISVVVGVTVHNNIIPTEKNDATYVDSIAANTVENMINPLFSTVDEVLSFRDLSIEGESIDAEFNQMSEDILKTVASVCIRRDGPVSKRGIIYEYRANRKVYDNLPENATQTTINDMVNKSSATEGSSGGEPVRKVDSIPVGEVRLNYHDTVVGGKTYKVQTKTETTYEEKH